MSGCIHGVSGGCESCRAWLNAVSVDGMASALRDVQVTDGYEATEAKALVAA